MRDKRASERRPVPENVPVVEETTGRRLGTLVNLSRQGVLLLAERRVAPGTILQVELMLPEPPVALHLGLESLWSLPSDLPGYHWMGCQILSLSDADLHCLEDYLERLPADIS